MNPWSWYRKHLTTTGWTFQGKETIRYTLPLFGYHPKDSVNGKKSDVLLHVRDWWKRFFIPGRIQTRRRKEKGYKMIKILKKLFTGAYCTSITVLLWEDLHWFYENLFKFQNNEVQKVLYIWTSKCAKWRWSWILNVINWLAK